jgi:hypothetical protein
MRTLIRVALQTVLFAGLLVWAAALVRRFGEA